MLSVGCMGLGCLCCSAGISYVLGDYHHWTGCEGGPGGIMSCQGRWWRVLGSTRVDPLSVSVSLGVFPGSADGMVDISNMNGG